MFCICLNVKGELKKLTLRGHNWNIQSMIIYSYVSTKESHISLSNVYLPQLFKLKPADKTHVLLGFHDLSVHEPWTKHYLPCHFFTLTSCQAGHNVILPRFLWNLPRMAGKLKLQTGGRQLLYGTFVRCLMTTISLRQKNWVLLLLPA